MKTTARVLGLSFLVCLVPVFSTSEACQHAGAESNPAHTQSKPNSAEAHASLAWQHYSKSDYHQAVARFDEAARLNPKDHHAYYGRGCAYRGLRMHEKALESYQKAVSVKPEFAKAHAGLGWEYLALGQHEHAAKAFKEAIRISPESDEGYYGLGCVYFNQRQYETALTTFEQLVQRSPNSADGHRAIG